MRVMVSSILAIYDISLFTYLCNNGAIICWKIGLNIFMYNVPKWSDTIQNLAAFAARFLKCV